MKKKPAKKKAEVPGVLKALSQAVGGKIDWVAKLPDGSGAATMSIPLRKDHWIYQEGFNEPPMPFRKGTADKERDVWVDKVRAAAKYAIRASTMNGKEIDFDPDAMVQNMVIGMLGYYTVDGNFNSGFGDWGDDKEKQKK